MKSMEESYNSAQYVLLKGEPGTRKSTCALSYPKPIYYFDFEQKMSALEIPINQWKIVRKDVKYDTYTDWTKAKMQLENFISRGCAFKSVVLDSITSMGDAINRQTLAVKYGTMTQSGSEAGKRIGGIMVNTIEDFNAETSAFQEMISLTKQLREIHGVNIILIAHVIQVDEKDPKGQVHVSRSLVTGGKKIAAKMPAYCTEIYHFNIKMEFEEGKGNYALFTRHMGNDFARTALPLPREITFGDEPLYDKFILPAINQLKGARNDVKIEEEKKTTTTTNTFTTGA